MEQASTTRLLSQLARAAAKFMQQTAEEEDLDLELTAGPGPTPALVIVPGAVEMQTGSERVLTLMAAKEGLAGAVTATVDFAPPDIVRTPTTSVKMGPSRRREDVLTGSLRVSAGLSVGATLLTARLATRAADCVIEVLEPETGPEPVQPEQFEFEREHYRVILGKPKPLLLRAPMGTFPDGTTVRVTSNGRGLVVLDGGEVRMRNRPSALAMQGVVRVEGRIDDFKAKLTASGPDRPPAVASAIVVRREESGAAFDTKLVPEVQGDQRAQWSGDYRLLQIMGEHPAVRPYLGDKRDGYPGQTSPQFHLLMAELVADAVVRRVLLEKWKDDEVDAGTLYVEQYKLLGRFLSVAHRLVAQST